MSTTLLVDELEIPAVAVFRPKRHRDQRGFLSEVYNKKTFAAAGIDIDFVQDNHAFSARKGTVRGLHFQIPPFAQDKLIRVVRGAVFDVAVDLRYGSPTYGRHVATVLSAAAWNQILVPVGFAHGFMTLEANSEVVYKASNSYSPEHDKGLRWNDPVLAIGWPLGEDEAILSDKDKAQPSLAELPHYFRYTPERAR